ncbi:hypothetical protein RRG08_011481 [Elysia crispata]|uniref:Uncharacterized protein n=1 Tax=Elysia crispata TaxID=231223 RepID=A0AAE1B8Z1_9GAST|nr:hypothetical protein RRG08_011481 [Elysia crispata]
MDTMKLLSKPALGSGRTVDKDQLWSQIKRLACLPRAADRAVSPCVSVYWPTPESLIKFLSTLRVSPRNVKWPSILELRETVRRQSIIGGERTRVAAWSSPCQGSGRTVNKDQLWSQIKRLACLPRAADRAVSPCVSVYWPTPGVVYARRNKT